MPQMRLWENLSALTEEITDSNMIILGKDGTQVCEHFGQLSAPFLPAADAPPASALDGICSPTVVPEMCMPCPLEGLRTV